MRKAFPSRRPTESAPVARVFTATPVFAIAGRRVNAEYARRLRSAADAVALVPEGAYVLQNNAVGEPPGLLAAIAERVRAGDLRRVRMASLLPMGGSAASIFAPDVCGSIEWESLFASGVDRARVRDGQACFIPAQFHQIPRIIADHLDVDVTLIRVSPPDAHGWMSLGVNVDTAKAAIAKARHRPRRGDALHAARPWQFVGARLGVRRHHRARRPHPGAAGPAGP